MQMKDVVERIRNLSMAVDMTGCSNESEQKVSDEIAALRAENERLRAALRDMLRLVEDDEDDPAPYLIDVVCDRARAALEVK